MIEKEVLVRIVYWLQIIVLPILLFRCAFSDKESTVKLLFWAIGLSYLSLALSYITPDWQAFSEKYFLEWSEYAEATIAREERDIRRDYQTPGICIDGPRGIDYQSRRGHASLVYRHNQLVERYREHVWAFLNGSQYQGVQDFLPKKLKSCVPGSVDPELSF